MNSYFKPILNNIYTTDDADTLVSQIDNFLGQIYATTTTSIPQLIDQNLPKEVGEEIKKSFLTHGQSFEHREEVKSFFLILKEELSKCKVMTLNLAYRPPQDHIKRLKTWCIENIEDNVILQIQFDSDLIAGAVIIFSGHYLDYSVKTKLETYFANKKEGEQRVSPQAT